MLAEMAPIHARYDVLITAGPGPAPPLESWRTLMFWQKPSLTTPFNVTGSPALVQCSGFTPAGLPLSLQLIGRPFDEATVLRVAHAYETATPWRGRRPVLDPTTPFSTALPPVPGVPTATLSAERRQEIAARCRSAGLTNLTPRMFEQLCATVPYIEAMIARLRAADHGFGDEPAGIFTFPADQTTPLWP
jgi:aspartyl-tRNA(Asn)/glutamyl-tRNA(Gln) amidotransferase subunit A